MSSPRVSVILPAYNAADYLRESIDSILNQTFADFELIVVNDGSTDKTADILATYKDPRLKVIAQSNQGLVNSLNRAIGKARAPYIARQDADDISDPTRLAKEVAYLDAHPNVALVGSNYAHIDTKSKRTGTVTNIFTHPDDLKITLVCCNQYGHGSVMLRKSALPKTDPYDKSVGHVEDYDLWIRLSRTADVANIEEPLYMWRRNDQGITLTNQQLQIEQTFALRDKAFEHFLKNRRQYRLFRYHPSGDRYRDRKAIVYRDYAYLYRARHKYIRGFIMLGAAVVIQPRNKLNYRLVLSSLRHLRSFNWEYEWL